jgi:hypothetical protein
MEDKKKSIIDDILFGMFSPIIILCIICFTLAELFKPNIEDKKDSIKDEPKPVPKNTQKAKQKNQ